MGPEAGIVFQDFTDALWHAENEAALRTVAESTSRSLGFRWFAYLALGTGDPILLSSYAKQWTDHYFEQAYETVDPVVARAATDKRLFAWG